MQINPGFNNQVIKTPVQSKTPSSRAETTEENNGAIGETTTYDINLNDTKCYGFWGFFNSPFFQNFMLNFGINPWTGEGTELSNNEKWSMA